MAIEHTALLLEGIPGWGVDLSHNNRPGYPKEAPPPHGTGAHWIEPDRQKPKVRIFTTVERDKITPVFGTTCPPKGLSGLIRSLAYRLGEAKAPRWMLLLLADRVDVVESLIVDVFHGRVARPFKEMGLRSEWEDRFRTRRNRRNKTVIGGLVFGVAVFGLRKLMKAK